MSGTHPRDYAEMRERYATFHPSSRIVPLGDITRPNDHWDDFDLLEAYEWAGVMRMAQQAPMPISFQAFTYQALAAGKIAHSKDWAQTAGHARLLGFTPATFWELQVALRTLDPAQNPRHPRNIVTDTSSRSSMMMPFEPEQWALWPRIFALSGDALESTRICLDGFGR